MTIVTLIAATGLLAGTAQAGPVESSYTRIENCLLVEQPFDEPVTISACPGHDGTTVLIASHDHGSAAAFGPRGHEAQFGEAPPRFAPLLTPGEVVEWRIADGTAYATILRWFNADYENETVGNWLVVSALRPEAPVTACQVAYVDTLTVGEANVLARQIADRLAPRFACGEDLPLTFRAGSEDLDAVLAGWESRPR